MLVPRHIAAGKKFTDIDGLRGEMRCSNNKLVAAAEKCVGHGDKILIGNRVNAILRHSGSAQFILKDIEDMTKPGFLRKVHFLPRKISRRKKIAVILLPILDGHDLE